MNQGAAVAEPGRGRGTGGTQCSPHQGFHGVLLQSFDHADMVRLGILLTVVLLVAKVSAIYIVLVDGLDIANVKGVRNSDIFDRVPAKNDGTFNTL